MNLRTPRPKSSMTNRVIGIIDSSMTLVGHVIGHVEQLVLEIVDDSVAVARETEELYDVAAKSAALFGATIRAAPRFTRITKEILQLIISNRIYKARSQVLWGSKKELAARMHQETAERLYQICVELGGGVLKIGQFASTRMDLLPTPYIESLSRLQDQVPPIPFEHITARLESELGAPPEELFGEIESEAIATASLAQVHGAKLKDGTQVAVKVQLPEIEKIVEIDLAAARVLCMTLEHNLKGNGDNATNIFSQIDYKTTLDELEISVMEELDFRRELENARAMANHFADDPDIVVPEIYDELSEGRVLTMERLHGQRLIDFLDGCLKRGEEGQQELDQIFTALIRCYCSQVLEHGLFQADPHPGNFLVLEGPRLGLLDFGAVKAYSEELRRSYAGLASSILARDNEQVAQRLQDLGFLSRNGSFSELVRISELLMDTFRPDPSTSLDKIDPGALFEETLVLVHDNPVVSVPQHFVLLGRVFASLGGLLLRYRPKINMYAIISPYIAPYLASPSPSV